MTKYRIALLALSICASPFSAHGQSIQQDALPMSSDVRGRPGEFFNRHSISQWRADYVMQRARQAPATGFVCQNVAYVAFMKVLRDRNFLFQSMPSTGSDYDVRADKIQTFRIDHNDPSATFVFGCWSKLPDFGDFDRADSLWIIPGNSPLRVCEVTLGRAGKATCY